MFVNVLTSVWGMPFFFVILIKVTNLTYNSWTAFWNIRLFSRPSNVVVIMSKCIYKVMRCCYKMLWQAKLKATNQSHCCSWGKCKNQGMIWKYQPGIMTYRTHGFLLDVHWKYKPINVTPWAQVQICNLIIIKRLCTMIFHNLHPRDYIQTITISHSYNLFVC